MDYYDDIIRTMPDEWTEEQQYTIAGLLNGWIDASLIECDAECNDLVLCACCRVLEGSELAHLEGGRVVVCEYEYTIFGRDGEYQIIYIEKGG